MLSISLNHIEDHVCHEHGNRGALPCPWPKCKYGIAAEKFEVNNEGIIFTRRAWQSLLGDTYYSWENDALPNWFSVSHTFWNEARRNRLVTDTLPDIVYHYTSLEGLLGIVKHQAIWMSDFSYLNDKMELIYGAAIAKDVIRQMIEAETKRKSNNEIHDLLSTWIVNLDNLQNRICIASFSVDDDSLSQWRAYGPIAIGFSTPHLSKHVRHATLQPVEYRPDLQKNLLEIYLHHTRNAFALDSDAGSLPLLKNSYYNIEGIFEIIAFFKDPAFSSEKEYRLTYVNHHEAIEKLGLQSLPKNFRVSEGRIIPYVSSIDIPPHRPQEFGLKISEVVLGPNSDELLYRGVREFLDANGLVDVGVRCSTVPLRT